ncbi:MAG: hypothetical protein GXP27_17700 [Planctomycetes bacterium]|nr:hypothetical protein [Planctomycetota bacterium]
MSKLLGFVAKRRGPRRFGWIVIFLVLTCLLQGLHLVRSGARRSGLHAGSIPDPQAMRDRDPSASTGKADASERPVSSKTGRHDAPLPGYRSMEIEGWTVHVHQQLFRDHADLRSEVERLLHCQLYQISRVIPDRPLARLREVPIWVEYDSPKVKCACYHPDKNWLKQNGYAVEKTDSVEIGHARRFVQWTLQQPWMLLHEFAHAYHERVLGWDYPPIIEAYEKAKSRGAYQSVLHHDGRRVRAYAMNNAKEYFAEACEAYFGMNDFYPFVRSELRDHDPQLYELLKSIWGLPKGAMDASAAAHKRNPSTSSTRP